ncbi:MAG: sigma-70 family RNA polymerase sigma factor [Tepidisphaeraceae bacterium]
MSETVEQLLAEWKASPNDATRNRIVVLMMPFIETIAKAYARRSECWGILDADDFKSLGAMAVMQCVESFDPARGVRFTSYAQNRVRGRILDELRLSDFVPRLERQREAAIAKLRSRLGRFPTWQEVHKETGHPTRGDLATPVEAFATRDTGSLSAVVFENDNGVPVTAQDFLESREPLPSSPVEQSETVDYVLKSLSREERLAIRLHYLEGIPMNVVGRTIGISQSRVSQMLKELRERLAASERVRVAREAA